MKATEIYERTTAHLIKQIESGDLAKWEAPWHGSNFLPRNASTNNTYSGGNVLILWGTAIEQSYPSNLWATYRQWTALGAQVRQGEKGTSLVKWSPVQDRKDPTGERTVLVPSGFTVFNAAQVDGFTPPPTPTIDLSNRLQAVEDFFANIPSTVVEGSPAYAPAQDVILLPPVKDFYDHLGFYATSAHEHAHWTGHKDRLDRELSTKFGSEAYAFEELVAEISAAFTAAYLGFETTPRPDHASYISHWASLLKEDPKALFTAASLAQKATDHLISYQPTEAS